MELSTWPLHSECFPCVNSFISTLILRSAYFTDGETEARSSHVMWSHNQKWCSRIQVEAARPLTSTPHCSIARPPQPSPLPRRVELGGQLHYQVGLLARGAQSQVAEDNLSRQVPTAGNGTGPEPLGPSPLSKAMLPLISSSSWNPRFVHYPHPRVTPWS